MEILNTIWTALTTKNQIIIDIMSTPMLLIESTLVMLLFTQILNINSSKKQKIIYVATLSIIGLFSDFLIPVPYNTFINVMFIPILAFLIFKTNILKTILSVIVPYGILILVLSIIQVVYSLIFQISIDGDQTMSIPIYRLGASFFEYIIAYIIYRAFKQFDIKITLFDNMHKSTLYTLILNLFVGIAAIAIQSYLTMKYANIIPNSLLIANILALLIYFIISIYSLFRTNQLEITKKNLEDEKLYNKTITILYDSIRGFRHDFNNIVQAIGGYVSTKNIEGLKTYYDDLLEDCQRVNNLTLLSPEIINNPAIYSLLTSKYHSADGFGIKINLEVFLDLSKINMKTYELTRVLGILLDNAIEASSKCEEKTINIIIRKDLKINRQVFIIENTYLNKIVDIDRIFEKGYTDKKQENNKSHGLGLWEVRQILKRNNNLNLHTTKDDKFFKQQLEIYY